MSLEAVLPAVITVLAYVGVRCTARQWMASRWTQLAIVGLWITYGLLRHDWGVVWANLALIPPSLYGIWYWRRLQREREAPSECRR